MTMNKKPISELSMQTEPVKLNPGDSALYNNEPVEVMSVSGTNVTVRDERGAVKSLPANQLQTAPLQEVEMNPSSFAAAIGQGDVKKVLVGFEFEVLVPGETIKAGKAARGPAVLTKDQIATIAGFLDQQETEENDLRDIEKTFKPKADAKTVMSLKDAYNQYTRTVSEKLKAIFMKLPEDRRAKINKYIKQRHKEFNEDMNIYSYASYFAQYLVIKGQEEAAKQVRANSERPAFGELFGLMIPGFRTKDFMKYFDVDVDLVIDLFADYGYDLNYDEDGPDFNDGYYDDDFPGAARVLKPAIEQAMGKRVNIFSEYHQRDKNLKDWYIEPDGSLNSDRGDDDGSAEVVTPPMPPSEAMESLKKFYGIATNLNLYTNSSTGLHINVSIPGKLDILKLAVFLGDQYVLKSFGREKSEYATSVLKDLQKTIGIQSDEIMVSKTTNRKKNVLGQPVKTTKLDVNLLQQMARSSSDDHTASISNNGKYISFRHAGGDYLSDMTKIVNTVGRFIRAMVIASDPKAYRQEYLTKLVKLVGSETRQEYDIGKTPYRQVAAQIRKLGGVPVVEFYALIDDRYDREDFASTLRYNLARYGKLSVEKDDRAAKFKLMQAKPALQAADIWHGWHDRAVQRDRTKYEYREIVPVELEDLYAVLNLHAELAKEGGFTIPRSHIIQGVNKILPITDPKVVKLIRKLIAAAKEAAVKEGLEDPKDNPCWKGYHPVGTKKKNGRTVPNCVPNDK